MVKMKKISLEQVITAAEHKYAAYKGDRSGRRSLPSSQIHALAEALVAAINDANRD